MAKFTRPSSASGSFRTNSLGNAPSGAGRTSPKKKGGIRTPSNKKSGGAVFHTPVILPGAGGPLGDSPPKLEKEPLPPV